MDKYTTGGIKKLVDTVNQLNKDFDTLEHVDQNGTAQLEFKMLNELQVIEVLVGQVGRDISSAIRVHRTNIQKNIVNDQMNYIKNLLEDDKCEKKSSTKEK